MAAQEGSIEEVTEETTTPAPPRPKFGRGLSRRYSLYPSKSSLGTVRGALTAAIDIVKFLYTNEFTRSLGRDILFFGGSVVVIRMVVSAMQEEVKPN